jgi:hypothetical protein
MQKPLSLALRQPEAKEAIDKIINDPGLSMFISPAVSRDEVEQKTATTDESTQITDRRRVCTQEKIAVRRNWHNDSFGKTAAEQSFLTAASSRSFFEAVLSEGGRNREAYRSPMFRVEGLASQVFKQRLNQHSVKMHSFRVI